MLNAKKRMKDTQTYKNPIILLPIPPAASFSGLLGYSGICSSMMNLLMEQGVIFAFDFMGPTGIDGMAVWAPACRALQVSSLISTCVPLFTWQHFVCSRCLIGKADRHERPEAAASVKLLQWGVGFHRPAGWERLRPSVSSISEGCGKA